MRLVREQETLGRNRIAGEVVGVNRISSQAAGSMSPHRMAVRGVAQRFRTARKRVEVVKVVKVIEDTTERHGATR